MTSYVYIQVHIGSLCVLYCLMKTAKEWSKRCYKVFLFTGVSLLQLQC